MSIVGYFVPDAWRIIYMTRPKRFRHPRRISSSDVIRGGHNQDWERFQDKGRKK